MKVALRDIQDKTAGAIRDIAQAEFSFGLAMQKLDAFFRSETFAKILGGKSNSLFNVAKQAAVLRAEIARIADANLKNEKTLEKINAEMAYDPEMGS